MKRKKMTAVFMTGLLAAALCLSGCGNQGENADTSSSEATVSSAAEESSTAAQTNEKGADDEPVELTVFAAASMTETLEEIADMYEGKEPDVTLSFNFDSSGTLKTQIQEGAECDLFISAAQLQMDELDGSLGSDRNPEGLDFVEQGTRLDLLENKVVLTVPEGNPKGIESFDDLAQTLPSGDILMAMGNSDVPVGQYTQAIFAHYGLDEEALADAGALTYGSNVKEVTTQVKEASVDCGIVYATDAATTDNVKVIAQASEGSLAEPAIYPVGLVSASAHQEEAQAFLDFLQSDEAMAVFEAYGFTSHAVSE